MNRPTLIGFELANAQYAGRGSVDQSAAPDTEAWINPQSVAAVIGTREASRVSVVLVNGLCYDVKQDSNRSVVAELTNEARPKNGGPNGDEEERA